MRRFLDRRPALFCVLVTFALFALTGISRVSFPREPVGDIERLPAGAFEPPSGWDLVVNDLKSPEVLFWGLAILLAGVLILRADLGREVGLNRPTRPKNLRLVWFPLLVGVLALSGGVFVSGPDGLVSALLIVLIAAFGEEVVFRGVMWRALIPRGPVAATILTSILFGALTLGRTATDGPWPEAVRLTALAVCGGFVYAAIRWRTGSLWPVVLVHAAFATAMDLSTLGTVTYPVVMLLSTLGFVFYGLFLLRNRRVRADGGPLKPARVR